MDAVDVLSRGYPVGCIGVFNEMIGIQLVFDNFIYVFNCYLRVKLIFNVFCQRKPNKRRRNF